MSTLHEWKSKGQIEVISGNRIFFVEEGEGESLLLLHGFPTASWGWHKMWDRFIEHYHCLAPDLLGSGFSDKPDSNSYSILNLTAIILDLLETRGIKNLHILAHAYGVSVAQELLARMELDKDTSIPWIESICFVNGGLFPETSHLTGMQKILLTPIGGFLAKIFPSPYSMFKKNFTRTFGRETQPTEKELKEFWKLLTYQEGHRKVPKVMRYLKERQVVGERWVAPLLKTEIPLCLINSSSDKLSGEAVNRRWVELLHNHDLIKIEKEVGHYPPLECPDLVFDKYLKWRKGLENL